MRYEWDQDDRSQIIKARGELDRYYGGPNAVQTYSINNNDMVQGLILHQQDSHHATV